MKEHSPTRIARAAAQAMLLTQVAAVAPAAAATAPAAPAELKLKASTDRENPLDYAVGETISFNFRLDGVDALPEDVEAVAPLRVIWTRTGDDGARVVGTNAISLAEGFSVETKLGVPGMVRLVGKLVDCGGSPLKTSDGKEILFEGGAGAETEKMRLSTVEPADFDAFWAEAKARLAAVPFADGVELHEVFPADASAWTLEHYAFYAAKVPCFGPRPVTGWLVVPKNAAPHSLAVSAQFAGYGCTEVVPKPPKWGTPGKVFFDVNAHGYDLVGHDDAWFKEFRDSIYGIVDGKATRKPYALEPSDYDNPADTYLYYMALRVVRAFDYLKTRPEWNGRDIEASGGSQGGLQTMWAGGLVDGITKIKPAITGWCDLGNPFEGQGPFLSRSWGVPCVPGAFYFDGALHARRVPRDCVAEITRLGMGDYICPPRGVLLSYYNMPCAASATLVQGSTHGYVPPEPNQTFTISKKAAAQPR